MQEQIITMENFKKAKVVMLPTKNKSNLWLSPKNKLIYDIGYSISEDNTPQNQHLYIISDDIIKEGDWVLTNLHNKIEQVLNNKTSLEFYKQRTKKIIASTDNSLKIFKNQFGNPISFERELPQPSQKFIEYYINEYNAGRIITDILVEYNCGDNDCSMFGCKNYIGCDISQQIRINSKDNTITIKKVKESWNREEVISLLKEFRNGLLSTNQVEIEYTNKWIEENL